MSSESKLLLGLRALGSGSVAGIVSDSAQIEDDWVSFFDFGLLHLLYSMELEPLQSNASLPAPAGLLEPPDLRPFALSPLLPPDPPVPPDPPDPSASSHQPPFVFTADPMILLEERVSSRITYLLASHKLPADPLLSPPPPPTSHPCLFPSLPSASTKESPPAICHKVLSILSAAPLSRFTGWVIRWFSSASDIYSQQYGKLSSSIYLLAPVSCQPPPSKTCNSSGLSSPWAWPFTILLVFSLFTGSVLPRVYTDDPNPLRFSYRQKLLPPLTFASLPIIRLSHRKKLPHQFIFVVPSPVSQPTRCSIGEKLSRAEPNRLRGFLSSQLSLMSGPSPRSNSAIGFFGLFAEIVTSKPLLGMESPATFLSLRGVLRPCFVPGNFKKFFTELSSCVAVCTRLEEANRFDSSNSGGRVQNSMSHSFVIESKHSGFTVKILSTHSRLGSNSLSVDHLSALSFYVLNLYCICERGWIIPSVCSVEV